MGLEDFVDMSDEAEASSKLAELKSQYTDFKQTTSEKEAKKLENQGWKVFNAKTENEKITYFLGKPRPEQKDKKEFNPIALILIGIGVVVVFFFSGTGTNTWIGTNYGFFESIGLFIGIGFAAVGLNMIFDFIPFIGGKK